jgi:hypothetical protein
MANLWMANIEGAEWSVAQLSGNAYGLSAGGLAAVAEADGDETHAAHEDQEDHEGHRCGAAAVLLVRHASGPQELWSLLARKRADVLLNGAPLVLGVSLLADRDEITVRDEIAIREGAAGGGLRCFFSAERLAQVVAFPGGGPLRCPRCKQPIAQGEPAVQCPGPACGAWHHQSPELPCWTYGETCALCDQPTPLDAGFRWTPEDL